MIPWHPSTFLILPRVELAGVHLFFKPSAIIQPQGSDWMPEQWRYSKEWQNARISWCPAERQVDPSKPPRLSLVLTNLAHAAASSVGHGWRRKKSPHFGDGYPKTSYRTKQTSKITLFLCSNHLLLHSALDLQHECQPISNKSTTVFSQRYLFSWICPGLKTAHVQGLRAYVRRNWTLSQDNVFPLLLKFPEAFTKIKHQWEAKFFIYKASNRHWSSDNVIIFLIAPVTVHFIIIGLDEYRVSWCFKKVCVSVLKPLES